MLNIFDVMTGHRFNLEFAGSRFHGMFRKNLPGMDSVRIFMAIFTSGNPRSLFYKSFQNTFQFVQHVQVGESYLLIVILYDINSTYSIFGVVNFGFTFKFFVRIHCKPEQLFLFLSFFLSFFPLIRILSEEIFEPDNFI